MKRLLLSLSVVVLAFSANAKDYAISTPNSTLIISAKEGEAPMFRYYGSRADISDVRGAGRMINGQEAYPAYGTRCDRPFASLVKQHDGDNAVKLVVD